MSIGEPLLAFGWGFLSAVSLPLGAATGLRFFPSHRWTSSLMAFGGGALLAALTLELVNESLHTAGFWILGGGLLAGAAVFVSLNKALNGRGAFLRKSSTTALYLTEKKMAETETILERLSRVEILRSLPPEEVEAVVPFVRHAHFKAGETVFAQGGPGDKLYLIEDGCAEVLHAEGKGRPHLIAQLGPGDAFGEMALLTGETRSATVKAKADLRAWALAKEDFERLMEESPKLRRAVHGLLVRRLGETTRRSAAAERKAAEWAKAAKASVHPGDYAPTSEDIHNAQAKTGGAPLAIWLGILLDGIPESLVIGAGTIGGKSVSTALIAGVFLANFPEALSSAVGMRRQGMTNRKVMAMWGSLAVLTGVGAVAGNLAFGSLPGGILAFMEAVAAGAMLAMIAETMLPEAVEQGGSAVGLMTVLGFIAAVFATTFKPH